MDLNLNLENQEKLILKVDEPGAETQIETENKISENKEVSTNSGTQTLPILNVPTSNDIKDNETGIKIGIPNPTVNETISSVINTKEALSIEDTREFPIPIEPAVSAETLSSVVSENSAQTFASQVTPIRTPVDLSKDDGLNSELSVMNESPQNKIHLDEDRHNLVGNREKAVVSLGGSAPSLIPSSTLGGLGKGQQTGNSFNLSSPHTEIQNAQIDLLRTNIYYTKKLYEELRDLKTSIKFQSYFKYMVSGVIIVSVIVSTYYGIKMFGDLFTGNGITGLISSFTGSQGTLGGQASLFGLPQGSGGGNALQDNEMLKNTFKQLPAVYKEQLSKVVGNFLK